MCKLYLNKVGLKKTEIGYFPASVVHSLHSKSLYTDLKEITEAPFQNFQAHGVITTTI